MQRKIRIRQIIGTVLLILQAYFYLLSFIKPIEKPTDTAELAGYYTAYNLFLIIAIDLFRNVYLIKKRLQKQEQMDLIETIGKTE